MDKNTLSNYGWIVIAVLVLSVMIALATPFGEYIKAGVESTTAGLFDTSEKALNVVGMSAKGDGSGSTEKATVLDSGKCGDNLNWELLSDGTLHISGTGPMYDYIKYSKTRQSPWYKYRNEPYISDDGSMILNPDGTEYVSTDSYYADNPNGWHYNKIVIDEGVTYIGNWAFYRVCVDELTFPETVTETGYFCIRYSPTIKTVNLPNSLLILDDYGISRNLVLETINFGNSLTTLGIAACNNNPKLTTAILPDSVTSINQMLHTTHDGITGEVTEVGFFDACKSLKNVSLGSVTSVAQRTFLNCSSLESIVIPNTVLWIDEYAFANCESLKTVEFESGSQCYLIKPKAFINATNIESITGGTALETIENNAFDAGGMTSLKTFEFSQSNVYFQENMFNGSPITTATIGSGVDKIPTYMFMKSGLTEIYISNHVLTFGGNCLRECSSLENIYYEGTRAEWDAITKGNNWCYLTPNSKYTTVVHFLADGTTDTLANCK